MIKGIIQHRIFFIYVDLFDIDENGIKSKNRYYQWTELKRFTYNRSRAMAFLEFSDHRVRFINNQRFRLKGRPLTLTLLGRNEVFEQFKSLIQRHVSENELDPEYRRVRNQSMALQEGIDQAKTDQQRHELSKRWISLNHDLAELEALELKKQKAKMAKFYRDTIIFIILVLILITWTVVS